MDCVQTHNMHMDAHTCVHLHTCIHRHSHRTACTLSHRHPHTLWCSALWLSAAHGQALLVSIHRIQARMCSGSFIILGVSSSAFLLVTRMRSRTSLLGFVTKICTPVKPVGKTQYSRVEARQGCCFITNLVNPDDV